MADKGRGAGMRCAGERAGFTGGARQEWWWVGLDPLAREMRDVMNRRWGGGVRDWGAGMESAGKEMDVSARGAW